MNLLLFSPEEVSPEGTLKVRDRRADHLSKVIKPKNGDSIRIGEINGRIGVGRIINATQEEYEFEIDLNTDAPAPLDLTLILALPRPKMLRRTLQSVVSLGVKRIYLINAYKVEKSFWQSPWLSPDSLLENAILGLEQSGDTQLPQIHQRKLFKPFVEDELPGIIAKSHAWVAHPRTSELFPERTTEPLSLAVGPEGGFTTYEVGKLEEIGFNSFTFGKRILRVETFVPAIIGRLFY